MYLPTYLLVSTYRRDDTTCAASPAVPSRQALSLASSPARKVRSGAEAAAGGGGVWSSTTRSCSALRASSWSLAAAGFGLGLG